MTAERVRLTEAQRRDLITLAEQVEALAEPDEAVDAEVCKALGILSDVTYWPMPIDGMPYWSGIGKYGVPEPVSAYTASLDAVVALIERELPGWAWKCVKPLPSSWKPYAGVWAGGVGAFGSNAPPPPSHFSPPRFALSP